MNRQKIIDRLFALKCLANDYLAQGTEQTAENITARETYERLKQKHDIDDKDVPPDLRVEAPSEQQRRSQWSRANGNSNSWQEEAERRRRRWQERAYPGHERTSESESDAECEFEFDSNPFSVHFSRENWDEGHRARSNDSDFMPNNNNWNWKDRWL